MKLRRLLPLAALVLCANGGPHYQSSPERRATTEQRDWCPSAGPYRDKLEPNLMRDYVEAERKPELLREVNARLRALAADRGFAFANYTSVLAEADGRLRPELTTDGVHPLASGYALMVPVADAAIAEALGNGET